MNAKVRHLTSLLAIVSLLVTAITLAPVLAQTDTTPLSLTEVVSEARVGSYVAQVRTDSLHTQDVFELRRDGEVVFRIDDYLRVKLGGPVEGRGLVLKPGTDVSGDGVPDLVVHGWSGGAHCCFTAWVLSLGNDFRVLAKVGGANTDPVFFNADQDSAIEVEVIDWAFQDWPGSFAGSPSTRVVLDWTGNRLEPSPDLTGFPRPDEASLKEEAAELRGDPGWLLDYPRHPYKAVFSRVLDLLYAGYNLPAWEFLERSWGGDPIDKVSLVSEFGRRLERSQYFSRLEQARERLSGRSPGKNGDDVQVPQGWVCCERSPLPGLQECGFHQT